MNQNPKPGERVRVIVAIEARIYDVSPRIGKAR